MNQIIKLSEQTDEKLVFSSGSKKLDEALGGGFFSKNIYELFGAESGGKTSIALHAIADAQKKSKNPLYIDAEYKLNKQFATECGVDIDNLAYLRSNQLESVVTTLKDPKVHEGFDLIVIDTISALQCIEEQTTDVRNDTYGANSALITRFMKDIAHICNEKSITLIIISQSRHNFHALKQYSDMNTTTTETRMIAGSCSAVGHYAVARIELLNKTPCFKNDEYGEPEPIGQTTTFEIVKNHQGRPFKRGTIHFIFGQGISQELNLAQMLIKKGILVVKDGKITRKDIVIAEDKLELIDYIKQHQSEDQNGLRAL